MQSLWESNHSLRSFYGQRSIYSPSFPETTANRQLIQQIGEILATCNRRNTIPGCYTTVKNATASLIAANTLKNTPAKVFGRIAACKILRHYVKEETLEYIECVEEMEEKLVPNVVGWLARHGDVAIIYGVVRDMPWLLEKKFGGRKIALASSTRVSDSMPVPLEEKESVFGALDPTPVA